MDTTAREPVPADLVLQGGGSHGAFTWGVLDCGGDRVGFAGLAALVILAEETREFVPIEPAPICP